MNSWIFDQYIRSIETVLPVSLQWNHLHKHQFAQHSWQKVKTYSCARSILQLCNKSRPVCGMLQTKLYLVILIIIRIVFLSVCIQGLKLCIIVYSMLASNYTHIVFQRWPSLCLFLNIIIFVITFYIMFSSLYIIVLKISDGFLEQLNQVKTNVIKKTVWCRLWWNSHTWCLKM